MHAMNRLMEAFSSHRMDVSKKKNPQWIGESFLRAALNIRLNNQNNCKV